jgi:[protein-PII] uridylyltransferase
MTFDNQVQVAERMGYEDHSGRRAVEHFMQDYFRHATRVGELTRIFLTELEARHVKQAPAILGFLRGGHGARRSRTATRSSRTASPSRTRRRSSPTS